MQEKLMMVLQSEIMDIPPRMLAIMLQSPITCFQVTLATQPLDCVGRDTYTIAEFDSLFKARSSFLYVVILRVEQALNRCNRAGNRSLYRLRSKNRLRQLYLASDMNSSLAFLRFRFPFNALSAASSSGLISSNCGYVSYRVTPLDKSIFLQSEVFVFTKIEKEKPASVKSHFLKILAIKTQLLNFTFLKLQSLNDVPQKSHP